MIPTALLTRATIGFIRAQARSGTPARMLAEHLNWDVERLHRVAHAHGIQIGVEPNPVDVPVAHPLKPSNGSGSSGLPSLLVRPIRIEHRKRKLTVRLSLTDADYDSLVAKARQAERPMSVLVGALVEAVNDQSAWKRLLGLR